MSNRPYKLFCLDQARRNLGDRTIPLTLRKASVLRWINAGRREHAEEVAYLEELRAEYWAQRRNTAIDGYWEQPTPEPRAEYQDDELPF